MSLPWLSKETTFKKSHVLAANFLQVLFDVNSALKMVKIDWKILTRSFVFIYSYFA